MVSQSKENKRDSGLFGANKLFASHQTIQEINEQH